MEDYGRRKSPRVKARLKVRFKNAASFISEYTHNISKGGIFIRTKKPCALRDHVEVVLVMPETQEEISAFGEVIHIVTPEEETAVQPAGMGVHLSELSSQDHERIEKFINEHLAVPEKDISLGRREHERFETRIRVKFGSKEALVEEYIRNISHGGIFIVTDKPKSVGEQMLVILTHPETNEELNMHGEVVRVVTSEDLKKRPHLKPGMGVKFKDMNEEARKKIDEFIRAGSGKRSG